MLIGCFQVGRHDVILSVISVVGCVISIVALVLTVVFFAVKWKCVYCFHWFTYIYILGLAYLLY